METIIKQKKEAVEAEKQIEEAVEKVASELNINLPEAGEAPLGVRIITLLILLSGIAIVGSVLADVYTFEPVVIEHFLLRLVMGVLLLAIAYSLNRRKFYAVWLLFAAVVFAAISNIYLAVIPAAIFAYIYSKRSILKSKNLQVGKFTVKI